MEARLGMGSSIRRRCQGDQGTMKDSDSGCEVCREKRLCDARKRWGDCIASRCGAFSPEGVAKVKKEKSFGKNSR